MRDKQECKEEGGVWEKSKEICSLDMEFEDTGQALSQETFDGDKQINSVIIAGAILTAGIITSPIGVPLLVYGISRMTWKEDTVIPLILATIVIIAYGVGIYFLGSQVIPDLLTQIQNLIPTPP